MHLESGPASYEEISWIGSVICIGGFTGTILFGKIAEMFGKKKALLLLMIPHCMFWIIVLMSTQVYHLYIARIVAGLSGGGALRTISLFIAEISENNVRGRLGSLFVLFICAGTLIVFIAGAYLSFFTVSIILLTIPIIYFILVLFLHDSPHSLMARNKSNEAWESLKFYRTCGKNQVVTASFKEEFELIKSAMANTEQEKLELKDFRELIDVPNNSNSILSFQ